MKHEFTEHISGIGDVQFVQNPRSKRINLRLKPGNIVRVSFPPRTSISKVKAFVTSRKQWISDHRKKLDALVLKSLVDPEKGLRTHFHIFQYKTHDQLNFKVNISNGLVKVCYPREIPVADPKLQDGFKSIVIAILQKEAQNYLPGRVDALATEFGFSYKRLSIKNTKSKWGSCSAANNINLSLHLMQLPFHLIDFIIKHELCHTIHKNHGPEFYKLLDKITDNAKVLQKEVRDARMIWV